MLPLPPVHDGAVKDEKLRIIVQPDCDWMVLRLSRLFANSRLGRAAIVVILERTVSNPAFNNCTLE